MELQGGIRTRFTTEFGLKYPVVLAPMASASGGLLAAHVQQLGGLGLLGVGYENEAFIHSQLAIATKFLASSSSSPSSTIGAGFITWKLAENPSLFQEVLTHHPSALWFSFGDAKPFLEILERFCQETTGENPPYRPKILVQVHTLEEVKAATELSWCDAIVVQGLEAGGHGLVASRATTTFCLIPQAADLLEKLLGSSRRISLLAAGGVADGRGLAAALLLGADGVVIGSRFLATLESNTHPNLKQRLVEASSASSASSSSSLTTKTQMIDVIRGYNWPSQYDARLLSSAVIRQATLIGSTSSPLATSASASASSSLPSSASSATSLSELLEYYKSSMEKFDYSYDGGAVLFVGQCLPLLHQIESVDQVFNHIVSDAAKLLSCAPSYLQ